MKLELVKKDLTKPYGIRFVMPISGPALTEDLRRDYDINPEDTIIYYRGALEHIGIDVSDPKFDSELIEVAKGTKKVVGASNGSSFEIVPV